MNEFAAARQYDESETSSDHRSAGVNPLLEIDIRSQRLADTYPIRQSIYDRTNSWPTRIYRRLVARYLLGPLIGFLFPRVLNNHPLVQYLLQFVTTTQVQLLCEWTCDEGHICRHYEGHTGRHECVFGHVEGRPIRKCDHVCDCRQCDAQCAFEAGHGGIHKCHFRHYWSDIPATRAEQEAFRDDKYIGDYVDELIYMSPEEMKFSAIPPAADERDETWVDEPI